MYRELGDLVYPCWASTQAWHRHHYNIRSPLEFYDFNSFYSSYSLYSKTWSKTIFLTKTVHTNHCTQIFTTIIRRRTSNLSCCEENNLNLCIFYIFRLDFSCWQRKCHEEAASSSYELICGPHTNKNCFIINLISTNLLCSECNSLYLCRGFNNRSRHLRHNEK